MSESSEQTGQGGRGASRGGSKAYADVGDRVAAVLTAAEEAAIQIRDEAEREAEHLLVTTRADVDAMRGEAEAYAADVRAAVDTYAAQRRREADEQAQQQLAAAEAIARSKRESAEELVQQIEEAARQRQLSLASASRSVEESLQRVLREIRSMHAQLEALAATPATVSEGTSLVDALAPQLEGDEDTERLTAGSRRETGR